VTVRQKRQLGFLFTYQPRCLNPGGDVVDSCSGDWEEISW